MPVAEATPTQQGFAPDSVYAEWSQAERVASDQIISDGRAREIAAGWVGSGEVNVVARFASTGEIVDGLYGTAWLVAACHDLPATGEREKARLVTLADYIVHHGERGPVEGWSA